MRPRTSAPAAESCAGPLPQTLAGQSQHRLPEQDPATRSTDNRLNVIALCHDNGVQSELPDLAATVGIEGRVPWGPKGTCLNPQRAGDPDAWRTDPRMRALRRSRKNWLPGILAP